MLPPYVIRGGLKIGRGSSANVSTRPASGAYDAHMINLPPVCSATGTDTAMDIDFDQLDLSNLDLGILDDDMGMTPSLRGEGLAMTTQMETEGLPVFAGFDITPSQEALMSEQDVNQLSGYMAGFQ